MAAYRRYTDDEKAQALAFLKANRGNYKVTSRQVGIPWATLRSWEQGVGVNDDVAKFQTEKRADLATRLEELTHIIIDQCPGKVADAGLRDALTSIGIAIDKIQLLREAPPPENDETAAQDPDANAQKVIVEYQDDNTTTAAPV